jgi:hypothetical protein
MGSDRGPDAGPRLDLMGDTRPRVRRLAVLPAKESPPQGPSVGRTAPSAPRRSSPGEWDRQHAAERRDPLMARGADPTRGRLRIKAVVQTATAGPPRSATDRRRRYTTEDCSVGKARSWRLASYLPPIRAPEERISGPFRLTSSGGVRTRSRRGICSGRAAGGRTRLSRLHWYWPRC